MFFRPWHLPHFVVTAHVTAENERWIETALICWLFNKQPRENPKKTWCFFCKRHLQTWKLNLPPFGISRSKRTCAHFSEFQGQKARVPISDLPGVQWTCLLSGKIHTKDWDVFLAEKHLSNQETPGCLGYSGGWDPTQLYIGIIMNPYEDPVIKPGFNGKCQAGVFFVAHVSFCFRPVRAAIFTDTVLEPSCQATMPYWPCWHNPGKHNPGSPTTILYWFPNHHYFRVYYHPKGTTVLKTVATTSSGWKDFAIFCGCFIGLFGTFCLLAENW